MEWEPDAESTAIARTVFAPLKCQPVVHRNGRQLVITRTPFGRIEILPVESRLLVVAERPPCDAPGFDPARCPPNVRQHMVANGLRAWKHYHGPHPDLSSVLSDLLRCGSGGDGGAEEFSPLLCQAPPAVEVVGEHRQRTVDQLVSLLRAHRLRAPVALVRGRRGSGRRTIAAAAAARLGLVARELPLSRLLLVDRILQSPLELFLDVVMCAGKAMGSRDILIVSAAQLLARLIADKRRFILDELSRLPNVVLIVDSDNYSEISCVVHLNCQGLTDTQQATRLLDLTWPSVSLSDEALKTFCDAANVPVDGILPGYLLFLVNLALTAAEPRGDSLFISREAAEFAVNLGGRLSYDDEPR